MQGRYFLNTLAASSPRKEHGGGRIAEKNGKLKLCSLLCFLNHRYHDRSWDMKIAKGELRIADCGILGAVSDSAC